MLFRSLFAAGVLPISSDTASAGSASGSNSHGAGVTAPPSWEGVGKQGLLVVKNGELASLDRGAAAVSAGSSPVDFMLFIDRDTGRAHFDTIFNNVYFAPFAGTPDAQACAQTLASQKRQAMELKPAIIGQWICVSTYEEHVGAIQPVKISAEEKEVTFNFVLWKDSPTS